MQNELSPDDLLTRIPYFADLPASAQQAIRGAWRRQVVAAGTLLFSEGEPSAGLYAVAAGRVRVFKLSADGREQGLHVMGPGETFNDISALDGGSNPASALALEPTILYLLDPVTLTDLMIREPTLARAIVTFLAERVRFLVNKVEALAFHSVSARLARLLLEQAATQEATDEVALERQRWLTQQELAAQLGTAREVVGRVLRQFVGQGLIEMDRNRIVLLDSETLRDLAAGL